MAKAFASCSYNLWNKKLFRFVVACFFNSLLDHFYN